ncbi:autotransporter outer membrane beta-barrel domain-containing protein [Pseudomonas sp. Fl4BN1]|uniref:autotransporter family protein n=1 Tax=Pseudomonas sp. Fl4BN1 TaxID=2697651 RepID=UPI002113BD7B|nr:autotransporter outer membrane beta-barrel domain-containing protein [Pseudomonas sp. Fl4BN1]
MQRFFRLTLLGIFTMPLSGLGLASDYGQVDISDPTGSSSMNLSPGDSVTYDGPGAAIDVSIKGNSLSAEGITVSAGSPVGSFTAGVKASKGGRVNLADSQVLSYRTYALEAVGADSVINASGTSLVSLSSFGAYAHLGGRITLDGGSISTTGSYGYGVDASDAGSVLTASNLTISTNGNNADGASVVGGASMTLEAVAINATGASAEGLYVRGAGSTLAFINSHGVSASSFGARVGGGSFSMLGGSLTGHDDAVYLGYDYDGIGSTADIRDATLISSNGYGLNLNGDNASATLNNVSIITSSSKAGGIFMFMPGSKLIADRFSIDNQGTDNARGLDNRAGQATLTNGSITTHGVNSYGLYLVSQFDNASIHASRVGIETFGAGSIGALSLLSGSELRLDQSWVTTHGSGASGLVLGNGAMASLESSRLTTHGDAGSGIWSYVTSGTASNTLSLTDSHVSTQNAAALLVSGGNHRFTLIDSDLVARSAGQEAQGVVLQTGQGSLNNVLIDTGQVSVEASGSSLTGDVFAQSGRVDLSLRAGSVLNGAVYSDEGGRVNSLLLDASSQWNVRNDSTLGTLSNSGTLAFVAAPGNGFKTLTVNDYLGGGTLVVNTQLGDDNSPTDRMIIDGGAASGKTAVRVLNAGGVGGLTEEGIRLVQTINGGTSTADAFYLDSGSSGYRASADSLSINGYEYSLAQGGNAGLAQDWYLISPPGSVRQVAPESGAHVGNQMATRTMFSHSLQDRATKRSLAADGQDSGLWLRVQGRHDNGLRMAEGKVDIDSSSDMVQLGGALLRRPLGMEGAFYAGLMAGYGDARIDSTSALIRRDTDTAVHSRAHGKVSGYSVGGYGTFYADDVSRLGAYVDTWLQYGRYTNQISSELGSASYDSTLWSASIESGYGFLPFATGSSLSEWVFEPRAQLIYSRYAAKNAQLQSTGMRSTDADAWSSSTGVRFYPKAWQDLADLAIRPFVETNWLHTEGTPSVQMGSTTLSAQPSRDALELKLGVNIRASRELEVSSHVFGHEGSAGQYGYGGQLNLSYSW